ncbi:MAG: hypothetical protein PSV35_00290 [bacterium]|nr:hypothetical protein [bacterium]
MTEIIKPLLTGKPFESTNHRLYMMFQPIQKTAQKQSDVAAYLLTPILDYVVLDTAFALDAAIRLINATASLLKAAYLWTLNQQNSTLVLDTATDKELDDFVNNLIHIASSFIAQVANIIFSTLSLLTRPMVSIVEEICVEDERQAQYQIQV